MTVDAATIGNDVLNLIKSAPWFPYKTGNLKFNATRGEQLTPNTYRIVFDTTVAPYIEYLEEGTNPYPFGTSGRFNGKFHPGSNKHKGFISNKAVNTIVEHICNAYGGTVVNVEVR